jgi:hypothetical protein
VIFSLSSADLTRLEAALHILLSPLNYERAGELM